MMAACSLANCFSEPGSARDHSQLFLLRLHAWIFFSWFFIYLAQVRGLNLKASAFYAMLPPVAMSVCSFVGGAISDGLTKWRGPRLGRCGLAAFGIATGRNIYRLRLPG